MTGGTTQHNKLALNLATGLNVALNDLNYEIYIGDVKLWIPRYREFTYPDVMVIEGQPVYYSTNTTIVTNPLLIAEVLSKSTKDYDRGDKFLYYRSIPEFKEYILIDQTQYYVMQYVKTSENQWILTEYETEDAMINLSSINVELSLKQLYKKINFSENLE
jgi:Uma2 family endonuclease